MEADLLFRTLLLRLHLLTARLRTTPTPLLPTMLRYAAPAAPRIGHIKAAFVVWMWTKICLTTRCVLSSSDAWNLKETST
jgi:hypothetical protein